MISCTRCLAVQSTFQLQDVLDDTTYEYDPDCEECKTHRQVNGEKLYVKITVIPSMRCIVSGLNIEIT